MAEDLRILRPKSDRYFFFSYCAKDKETLLKFAPNLGFDIWYDNFIEAEEDWEEEIEKHILGSCAMIINLSHNALSRGVESPVYTEWKIAVENNIKVIFIRLERMKAEDFEDSTIREWFGNISKTQMYEYKGEESVSWLQSRLSRRATEILLDQNYPSLQSKQQRKNPLPVKNHSIAENRRYAAISDLHINPFDDYICTYDRNDEQFVLSEISSSEVFAKFKFDRLALSKTRVFLSTEKNFMFFVVKNRVYIADVSKKEWISSGGIHISLSGGEELTSACPSANNNFIFFFSSRNNHIYRMITIDIRKKKVTYKSLEKQKLVCIAGSCFSNRENIMLFLNEQHCIHAYIPEQDLFFERLNQSDIDSLFSTYKYMANRESLFSEDGKIYLAGNDSWLFVCDSYKNSRILELKRENIICITLLANRNIIFMDADYNLHQFADNQDKVIIGREFFSNPVFERNLPLGMIYYERTGLFIFPVKVFQNAVPQQKLVFVNNKGKIIAESELIDYQKNMIRYVCDINQRGELYLTYFVLPEDDEYDENCVNSYIFSINLSNIV